MTSTSPKPSKVVQLSKGKNLNAHEAIQELLQGKRIRKDDENWGNDYVFLMGWPSDDAHLTLMKNGVPNDFIVRAVDLLGDWNVVAA
jgi:hypothetical protein